MKHTDTALLNPSSKMASMLFQVVVFSWTGCPFCKNAKALLDSKGAKYTAVELNTMDDGNAIRAQLAQVS